MRKLFTEPNRCWLKEDKSSKMLAPILWRVLNPDNRTCLMKAFITAMALLVIVVSAGAQGDISFRNTSNTLVTYCGGTAVPAGNQFNVDLYYAPDSPTPPPESAFIAIGGLFSTTGHPVGFLTPGRFNGGTRVTPFTTQPGQPAWFEVRVWETAYGSTYEEAIQHPGGFIGASPPFSLVVGSGPPGTPTPLTSSGGFTGLDLGSSEQCIPEPSTVTLIVFGLALLGCCWPRKPGCTKSSTGPREPDIC